ncbi:MAG TPA: mechanosensitive ion channel domain-containing protein [Gemmatimonadales bacterium]
MTHRKPAALVLGALALIALIAMLATWSWGDVRQRVRSLGSAARRNGTAVDTRPLEAAQQLEQLAQTRTERSYAAEALRLGDYSVDFAFAAAIRQAANAPTPSTPETRAVMARLTGASAALDSTRGLIKVLTARLASGPAGACDATQQQLDEAQAQLELQQDEIDDARQDLIRAGGDRLAAIQRVRDQHDSAQHHPATATEAASATPQATSVELTRSSNLLDQAAAWLSLESKLKLLRQARQSALDRVTAFSLAHDTLEKQVAAERGAQRILHPQGRNAGTVALTGGAKPADSGARRASPSAASPSIATDSAVGDTRLVFLKDLATDQKDLSDLDRRVENEQDLAAVYASWIDYVTIRQQSFVHGGFVAAFWALLIALIIVVANRGVRRAVAGMAQTNRTLHTLGTVALFTAQAIGILVIALVIFGIPSNFATVIALTGAGLALALQDFIVGFFGWFVLMGKDGMRVGDWVEINGVSGEVLDVGVFQTVLLETSDGSGAADPTGRKVSFVNSFAIEGHYFNFSTSGQWLWDELEVDVPTGMDPYTIAEEIQRVAAEETAANAAEAETDWQSAIHAPGKRPFSAAPAVSVRPAGGGVTVQVRYLTKITERQATRATMYRAMIELLRGKPIESRP